MVGLKVLPTDVLVEASGMLLVVARAEETAKRIENHLRNNGHPLRVAWITARAELEDVLRRSPPDLVMCEDADAVVAVAEVIESVRKLAPAVPILVLNEDLSAERTGEAMLSGVQDCVSAKDTAHLRHLERAVIRELIKHHHHRELDFTRRQLQEYQSRHQQLTEGTFDAVALVQEGILVEANPAFAKLLGVTSTDELIGSPMVDLVIEEQQNRIKDRLRQVNKGKHSGEPLELSLRAAGGRVDVKARLILSASDGEQAIELLIRNDRAALSDPARGGSRMDFAAALRGAPESGKLRAASLLRVDRFGELEEQLGPLEAEALCLRLVQTLEQALEPDDQIFRFSSDELALILDRGDIGDFDKLHETLQTVVSGQIITTELHEARITVSAAIYPLDSDENIDSVVRQIVAEVRKTSREGGNRVCTLGGAAKTRIAERQNTRMIEELRDAFAENRLRLAYQGIGSLEGRGGNRFDILLRMIGRDGVEHHGAEFFPLAEQDGTAAKLDRWVVSSVMTTLAARKDDQILFVKLSESTIRNAADFSEWLRAQLQATPLKTETLVLELSEAIALRHLRKTKDLAEAARALGIHIAIEHFGTSSTSLQLIEHLPCDYVKFDARFTREFSERDVQRRFAELMEVARQRHIKTIVAKVEDNGLMAELWQMGVNFVQGFHVQEPEVVLLSSPTPKHVDH